MAKLKIAGTWVGVIEAEVEKWTVTKLREEIASRSNCGPHSINLICAGKLLKDGNGNETLTQLGVKNNSRILATKAADATEGKSIVDGLAQQASEDERTQRLARLRSAASALAGRHADGSFRIQDYDIELEDQSGKKINLGSETDQRAVMMGLMLHANAKKMIKNQKYKDALDILAMGEEAFSLCDPKHIELIDNVPILQIDMVWCYFMLRDISWLSDAGNRLKKAREGIERAHGKDFSRIRILQGGCYPELALLVRLELLEGVVAYHSGQYAESKEVLTSAQERYLQLEVPDEALSIVMGMGFKERDAKRALRMSNQDVQFAINFLVEEKAKKARKMEEDVQQRKEIKEQKLYGSTPLKKAVDLSRLNELVSIGFERELAAEALRRNENDSQKALDDLTNPETNSSIQVHVETRKRKRQEKKKADIIERLVSMGFDRSRVVAAAWASRSMENAMEQLLSQHDGSLPVPSNEGNTPAGVATAANPAGPVLDNVGSSSSINPENDEIPTDDEKEERDVEMEDEVARELKGDAFSDYDIEITVEGEAIKEYLALLASLGTSQNASSSH